MAGPDEDPFELLDRQPKLEAPTRLPDGEPLAVAGSAISATTSARGSSACRLRRRGMCRCPTSRSPSTTTCFGSTPAGAGGSRRCGATSVKTALTERLELFARRLADGVRERPVWVGNFQPAPPGGAGHKAAVEECRERIAAGEIFQANLCLRLEAEWQGDPLDLFARTASTLEPRHAGVIAGPWGAVCSLSPELFLRRRRPRGGHRADQGHRAARPGRRAGGHSGRGCAGGARRVRQGPRGERDDRRPHAQRPRPRVRVRLDRGAQRSTSRARRRACGISSRRCGARCATTRATPTCSAPASRPARSPGRPRSRRCA